jgi:hypothetical protein
VVEGVKVGLRAVGIGQRCDGSSSRARRARGGGGASVLRPGERGKAREGNGGSGQQEGRRIRRGVFVRASSVQHGRVEATRRWIPELGRPRPKFSF